VRSAASLSAQPWEGETLRTDSGYLRWVQASLNRVLGLRLAVDGIEGPATRSAVRSFQQRRALAVDGIVGPNTEAALIAAGAPRPAAAGSSAQAAAGGSTPQAAIAAASSCVVLEAFAQDDDRLTPVHLALVKSLATRLLGRWETDSLQLVGHASSEGEPAYNHDLAQRRAEEVEFALVDAMEDRLPDSSRWLDLDPVSLGETPIPGVTTFERQRRVDVCFPKPARWFDTGGSPTMPPVRAGNAARYLVNGKDTFAEMVRAIRTASAPGHYIYLLGWWLSLDFELVERKVMTTMHALLRDASARGVQVRAMLWDQWTPATQNEGEVREINGLRHGAAIHDNRVLASTLTLDHKIGSHHQKVLVVSGSEGLIAFCGGIDINPDRLHSVGATVGAPLQDVHCCIRGPAAHDLLKIFLERWQDHPDHAVLDAAKGALLGRRDDPAQQPVPVPLRPAGKMQVQIGRTYGNGRAHPGVPGGYSFARSGEQTARRMIRKAIAQASRFIYIEDQYLVSMEVSAALTAALRAQPKLIVIILIPHADATTSLGGQAAYRRQQFITPLRNAAASQPGRVGVFYLGSPPACAPGTYVHSKTMVVDDAFAIIGSANLCRRSLTHDSEAIAAIYDPSPNPFAKRLRQALWSLHLGLPASSLADGVASAPLWFTPRPGVCAYRENAGVRLSSSQAEAHARDAAWEEIDPDGS
jgi:phosphatidylserine/phosphatidylglycerophosphate/cardiolipin synthase-like enzyme/outer membrane protein OmpA-like peptidoglycan-associated protein